MYFACFRFSKGESLLIKLSNCRLIRSVLEVYFETDVMSNDDHELLDEVSAEPHAYI